ncbi:hypothetical protein [Halobaculum gomorrense]|uniref:Uncharacterized protein n=1 Tax=Halobaculum gomorrense TaxID=43928 RepID=A0A1M5UR82_9EURY|nr:hypothetical protein [Halobaculum gomorrense]SHH65547.1 hypothetical protein SAMN05443636_3103 [Halobaculum gomorrense]
MSFEFGRHVMPEPLPEKVSLESLEQIVFAWYSAGAADEACSNGDAARKLGIDSSIVSRNNKFLLAVDVLTEDGQSKQLTDQGIAYAEAIRSDQSNPAKAIVNGLFDFSVTQDIVDFAAIKNPSEEELIEQVETLTETENKSASSTHAFVDLLIDAQILYKNGEAFSARSEDEIEDHTDTSHQNSSIDQGTNGKSDQPDETEQPSPEVDQLNKPQASPSRGIERSIDYSVNINVEIATGDSEEAIEQTMRAVSDSLSETDPKRDSESEEDEGQIGLDDFD